MDERDREHVVHLGPPVQKRPARRAPAQASRSRLGLAWAWMLTAALLSSTVGLSVWVGTLEHRIEVAQSPRVNVPIVDLFPEGEVFRGPHPSVHLRDIQQRSVIMILHTVDRGVQGPYDLDLVDRSGRTLWSLRQIPQDPSGDILFRFGGSFLSTTGEHRVRLYPAGGAHARALDSFRFWVDP